MVPALRGEPQPARELLYWEFHERGFSQAVRSGRWKAVRPRSADAPLELYDLDADPAESRDLAADEPEVAQRLAALMAGARTRSEHWPGPGR